MKDTLIVLSGPTGVGKTSLSVELAEHFGSDIISCDSRQIYREMVIGTAAPDIQQLERVKHHFVRFLTVNEYYSASLFERDVLALLPELFAKNPVVVMTGGSMLYTDAVCKGIDDIPDTDPAVRLKYLNKYKSEGVEGLRLALKLLDPVHYSKVDLRNPRRLMRALEITESTGKPYSSFLTAEKRERDFRILKVGITLDRSELYSRIDSRIDKMIAAGLENEVRALVQYRGLNALSTVGYSEMFRYFDGEITFEQAVGLIRRNTRRYAKKQLTWWGKDKEIKWFNAGEPSEIIKWIDNQVRAM
jgi:tRNA dimethylallyltransferase